MRISKRWLLARPPFPLVDRRGSRAAKEILMPPRSYVVTAIVLAVLVAVSLPLTLGFSIILWYWLFAAAACILVVGGVLKVVNGLGASPWIGVALASPGIVWAASSILKLVSNVPVMLTSTLHVAASLTALAAAAGALRLVEAMSGPHTAVRVGYGVLAASALLVSVSYFASAMGWGFTRSTSYFATARAVHVVAALVKYGAFIAAAVLISMRRDIEPWTAAAVSLVSACMIYLTIKPLFVAGLSGDMMFWLLPVLMLVGSAAIWRMGSVLRAQAHQERFAPS
jgi:hypothetical protein